jgi:hypothetical protein
MIGAAGESILERRAHAQPKPHIVALGDCGACVLGGALGISIERVYNELVGKRETISHHEMRRLLRVAAPGLADRLIEDPAEWRSATAASMAAFGRPADYESLAWFNYVRMAVDAGYYGLAQVDFARQGGRARGGPAHWVLICGARTKGAVTGEVLTGEVLVSCSARNPAGEWIEARTFLRDCGGYNVLFVRPTEGAR